MTEAGDDFEIDQDDVVPGWDIVESELITETNDREHPDPADSDARLWDKWAAAVNEGEGDLDLSGGRYYSSDQPPAAILENIYRLDLSHNGLSEVPSWVERCVRLSELSLDGNPLSGVPNWIARLPLVELSMADCALTVLPEPILQLEGLEGLQVSSNVGLDVTGVSRLKQLYELDLAHCGLLDFPSELCQTTLEALYLNGNLISELPDDMGPLIGGLSFLGLEGNPLLQLPAAIGFANDSIEIRCDWAQMSPPYPDLGDNIRDVLVYVRSLERSESLFEAKLMLVGEGEVGKSSLIAALRREEFQAGRPTTHGIEINRLALQSNHTLTNELQLNTWDFGGQTVYRITHQFFFTPRAVYLVVWKPREGHEQNDVEGWIERLRLRLRADAQVIIVATHSDERRPELDYPALKRKFGDLLVGNVAVDSRSGSGLADLNELIRETARRLPQMGERISSSWLAVRREVAGLPETQISRLSYERIAAQHGLDEDAAATLLRLLHDLGHVIHYGDDDGLDDFVVLQPEWLTKAIGYVLEDRDARQAGGIIQHARLSELWEQRGYTRELHPYFLRLMEKFDISYRLQGGNSSLVPQLVPHEEPQDVWRWHEGLGHRIVTLRCTMQTPAPGLIAWLTARHHRDSTGKHWRNGVVLRSERYDSDALFRSNSRGNVLDLLVSAPSPDYYFHTLRDGLELLLSQRWPGLRYTLRVPCLYARGPYGRTCGGYFPLSFLENQRKHRVKQTGCHTCGEMQSVEQLLTGMEPHQEEGALANLVASIEKSAAENASTAAILSDIRAAQRSMMRFLSAEVNDTPRMFTVRPRHKQGRVGEIRRRLDTQTHWELHFWCEQPEEQHPISDQSYSFELTKQWAQKVLPYAYYISKSLRAAVTLGTSLVDAWSVNMPGREELLGQTQLIEAIASQLPDFEVDERKLASLPPNWARPVRAFLNDLDPQQTFAGLRRVITVSGDVLFICDEHYERYDPGLPQIG